MIKPCKRHQLMYCRTCFPKSNRQEDSITYNPSFVAPVFDSSSSVPDSSPSVDTSSSDFGGYGGGDSGGGGASGDF